MLSKSTANKTANEVSGDTVHRHNHSVPHFQNTALCHGTRLSVLTFKLMSENKAPHHYVHTDCTEFYRNRKTNMEVKYRDSLTPTLIVWHFTAPNFTKITLAVLRYVHIFYAEFNLDWLRSVEIKVRISFTVFFDR